MKKIISTLCMALTAVAMMAQNPVITFEKTEHDFGKINEADGRVSVVFSFKNEGMAPLVLSNVRASCGCTTPTWTKEPVEPGQSGSITVTYNPNGRPGRFQKTVTITSNASEPTKKVYIKGEVIPKQAKPVNKYTVAVGELSMKTTTLDLGTVKKGENKSGELEYANMTKEDHTVKLATRPADSYIINQVTLPSVKANEVGKFVFALESANTKLYGPIEVYAYVEIDGKAVQDDAHKLTIKADIVEDFSKMTVEQKQQAPIMEIDAHKLTIKADIVEDFSKMTVEQKQQAPIMEMATNINLGKVAAGKTLKTSFPIKNIGVNPLEVRRAYCADSNLRLKASKPIKSGKKGAVTVEINAKEMEPGAYSRHLQIISNDYEHSKKQVTVYWIVE